MAKLRRQKRLKRYQQQASIRECPNCGEKGAHYVVPSLLEEGFYICDRRTDDGD